MGVRIAIIGTGYVGLVTGACFAELGHDVVCVDNNAEKVALLMQGVMPIYEPALDQLVERNVAEGRLHFSTDTSSGVADREAVFIAVGTPSDPQTGRADLAFVFNAAAEIARSINRFTVVVTKSTVPVGTNKKVHDLLHDLLGSNARYAVASNPEFLREGAAIQDFMEPDRVVIGFEDPRAAEVLQRIYAPLTGPGTSLVQTNIATAEMIKYAANAFLAVKVSFINEVADLCEAVHANVDDVATGIGLDKRIGRSFLKTGPGWGGSCFPKDTKAMAMTASDASLPIEIVEAAIRANDRRKHAMSERIRRLCGGSLEGKRVAIFGLTFKGQTDDMRDSPSLDIIPRIMREGASVAAFDPSHPRDAYKHLPGIEICATPTDAANGADLLVVLTDWMVFQTYDLGALAPLMRTAALLDLRNLYNPKSVRAGGFSRFENLGRVHDWYSM